MAIVMKRQGGGSANASAAKVPTSLAYGEIAVDSAGNIYTANGAQEVVSQVKNAANVLFLYKGIYSVSGWTASSGYWTQTASVTPQDGGPVMAANFNLDQPKTSQTDSATNNEKKQEALGCICSGYCTPGAGQVTIKVFEKPTVDLDVYWYARSADGGYSSSVSTVYSDTASPIGIYYGTYKVDSWKSANYNGYTYAQTVAVNKQSSGLPDITTATVFITPGFFNPTGNATSDEALQKAMGIINSGYSTSDTNTITTYVTTKPSSDITVRWVAMKG